jgi:ferritin-like metal-binding protein YciE
MPGMKTLRDLFEDELRDVYDAEKQIIRALPRMIKATGSEELSSALEAHLEETRGHVERLERVFESIDRRPRGKRCEGMAGILEEGANLMEEDGEESVLDAGFIAAAQRVEHYEITAYGSLMAWAKALGLKNALSLLKENEQEEKAADQKLSALAESGINQAAAAGQEMAEEAMAGRRK